MSVNLPTGAVLTCLTANSKATPKWVQSKSRMFMPKAAPTLPIATPSESPTPTPVNNAPVVSNIRFQSSTIKAGESAQIFFTVTSSIGFSSQTGIVGLGNSSGASFSKILGVGPGGCVATSQTTLTCEGDVQISKTAPAGKYSLNIIGFPDNNNVPTTFNQQKDQRSFEVLTVTATPSESPTPTLPIATPSESPTPTPVNNAPVVSNIRFQSSTIKAGESAQIFFTVTSSIGFSSQTGIVGLGNSSGASFSKILGVGPGGCVATSQTTLTCEGDVQISKTAPAGKYSLNIIGFEDNNNVATTVNQQEVLTVTS